MASCRYGPGTQASGALTAQPGHAGTAGLYFSSSSATLHLADSLPFVVPSGYFGPQTDMGHLAPTSGHTILRDPALRRRGSKSAYKHVPHREKSPHLVARRNARERRRVQAVNNAFLRLRRHVPHENRHKRLSKVKTLRIAIDYINYLQRMIEEYDAKCLRLGAIHGEGRHAGPRPVDMVELTSNAKENRWSPCNLNIAPDNVRDVYPNDVYQQYHQG